MLKKRPKTLVKLPWNDESGHAFKSSLGRLDGNGGKKLVRGFNFLAADCLQVFNTGRDSGGKGGGVAEKQLGWNADFACPNMCGGNLVLSLYL
jgi:hypothetical protein